MAAASITGENTNPSNKNGIERGSGKMTGSYAKNVAEENDTSCRICRGEGSDEEPLFYPCKCSGSIKFVHQTCLMEWLSHSQKKYCELCKTHFRFTKLYSSQMPQNLPVPIFLRQLVMHVVRSIFTYSRTILVAFVWLGWLPWSIRHVWAALFYLADGRWALVHSLKHDIASVHFPDPSISHDGNTSVPLFRQINFTKDTTASGAYDFLNHRSQDLLVVKVIRLFLPRLYFWTMTDEMSETTNQSADGSLNVRPSSNGSLLSDVKCLQNVFANPRLNRILVQTLEGQLICLSIVATFILVFLIREWVINQQPPNDQMNNGERADQGAAAAPAAPPGPEAENHVRERDQRRLAHPANRPRRMMAMPRRRREHLRPNNPNDEQQPELTLDAGEPMTPSQSAEVPSNLITETEGSMSRDLSNSHEAVQAPQSFDAAGQGLQATQSSMVRPSLRARNTDQAPDIRRNLEENRSSLANQEWPGLDTFKSLWERGDRDPTQVLRIIDEEGRGGELGWIVTQMENLQRSSSYQTHAVDVSPSQEDTHNPIETFTSSQTSPPVHSTNTNTLPDFSSTHASKGSSSSTTSFGMSPFEDELLPHSLQEDLGSSPEHGQTVGREQAQSNRTKRNTIDGLSESTEQHADVERHETISRPNDQEPERTVEINEPSLGAVETTGALNAPEHADTIEALGRQDQTEAASEGNLPPNESILERIATKLWGIPTEPQAPTNETSQSEDDEQIVQDINQEPPFVPVSTTNHANGSDRDDADISSIGEASQSEDELQGANPEQGDGGRAAADEGHDPEVAAAAAEAGIDLNNAEAIDDAEDMDGILELIGLRGPLTGLLQNALFSDFLLTFTIAACVWLPYIWGKIAAVFLANPVTCFVTVPLQFASRAADTTLDLVLCLTGSIFRAVEGILLITSRLISQAFPSVKYNLVPIFDGKRFSDIISTGSASRIESAFAGIMFSLTPDFPTFSAGSHAALIVLKRRTRVTVHKLLGTTSLLIYEYPCRIHSRLFNGSETSQRSMSDDIAFAYSGAKAKLQTLGAAAHIIIKDLKSLKIRLHTSDRKVVIDYGLVHWNTQDRMLAILLGYAFFALIGYLYLRLGRYIHGLRKGEKLQGPVADTLRQAGGVLKVVLIIGIEMIVFPLYCGLLLDAALLPIFEGVGLSSRISFIVESPMTGLFVHWFIGTCYMFHFALFVSMCRRILRKGCLYFIRDPDDPTFHPVRDVLERPIATQLNKIAQSALVYGCLVIVCLGAVVWTVSSMGDFFPVRWASGQPKLEVPWDLLYFNFALPFLIRNVEVSGYVTSVYSWWFHKCAKLLRLSDFLFGKRHPDEEGRHVRRRWKDVFRGEMGDIQHPVIGEDRRILAEDREKEVYFLRNGRFVRAPASDSVRMRRGESAFLEVTENNERIDGQPDPESGAHGRKNTNYTKVYLPPSFRIRIGIFVLSVWLFAALTGAAVTLLPLTLGRRVIATVVSDAAPINDLYALSLGFNISLGCFGCVTYAPILRKAIATKLLKGNLSFTDAMTKLRSLTAYILGLSYLAIAFGIALPLLFSFTIELYLFLPLHTYMNSISSVHHTNWTESAPTIYIIQSWVLGLLYTRCIYRLAATYPSENSRAAIAISAITRDGVLKPNVALATRAFLIPACCLCGFLLVLPAPLVWMLNYSRIGPFGSQPPDIQSKIISYSYPGLLGLAMAAWCAVLVKRALGRWRMRIRDEVYLIGERLHNFGEQKSGAKPRIEGPIRTNSVTTRVDVGL